ncbi:MAG: FG-GAP repeat domain-containing protein, partial [Planctomycetota bacterium]
MRKSGVFLALVAFVFLLQVAPPAPAQVPAWVAFTDQSTTRISGPALLGISDPDEKHLAIGDVDGDGDTDLLVVRKEPFTTAMGSPTGDRPHVLFLNEGGVMTNQTATYAPDLNVPSNARKGALVDVDLDGWLDIVIANGAGDAPRILMNLGNGPSGWAGFDEEAWRFPALPALPHFCGLGVGDANGDGYADLFFGDYNNTLEDRLWFNVGAANPGVFVDVTTTNLPPTFAGSGFNSTCEIADMDGDGDGDLVKNSVGSCAIVWNNGSNVFNSMTVPAGISVYAFTVGDLDNDADLDLYFAQDPQDQIDRNPNGLAAHATPNWVTGQLSSAQSPYTSNFNSMPHMADVDDDGDLDVGVSDVDIDVGGFNRRFSLLRNNSNGNPTAPWSTLLASPYGGIAQIFNVFGTYDHAFLDVNGDDWLDLWIAYGTSNTSGGQRVFIQTPRARLTEIGAGCAGTNGVPLIGTTGTPQLGNAGFQVTVGNALPGSIAIHFLCLGQTNVPFGPCTVYADLFATLVTSGAVVTSPFGQGSV